MIPQLRDWDEKYRASGLTIVGVHSPEFFWEKPYDKLLQATRELGVRYPVVQDNDFAIWKRWAIRYWPTTILVDRRGVVRHRHIGEGAYQETNAVIQRLIAERD